MSMRVALLSVSLAVCSGLVMKKSNAVPLPSVLKLRGGIGGADPTTVAKYASGLLLANGAYCAIAPGPATEAYGMANPKFEIVEMVKALGMSQTAAAVLAL